MMIIILLIGLIVGAGAGYFLAPTKIETITDTVTVEKHPLEGKTIQIGCILPYESEPRQTFYKEVIEKDINEYVRDLGINVSFEFVMKDAEESDSTHLKRVEELNSEGINVLIGGSWSDMAAVSLDYINNNDMLMLSDSSTYPELALNGDNLYRLCTTELSMAEALGDIVYDFGIEYCVVGDDPSIEWSNPFYDIFKEKYESNGGTILGRTLDNDEMESIVSEAIASHGQRKVGVAVVVWMPGYAFQMVQDYEGLSSIYWFGMGENGRDFDIIEEVGGFQTQLRLFSPESSATASNSWLEFKKKYEAAVEDDPTYFEGTAYDAAWCIALTVLETGSTDALIIKEMLPTVAARFNGVTGCCALNQDGDRAPGIYNIWGYAEVDGEHTFINYGEYNAYTGTTTWDYLALVEQGIIT